MVSDEAVTLTGSYNWTRGAAANSEDLKLISSPAVAAAYATHWYNRLAVSVRAARGLVPGGVAGGMAMLEMQPLYAARIEDLGRGDIVQVDCAALPSRRAAEAGVFLLRLGLSAQAKVLSISMSPWSAMVRASGPRCPSPFSQDFWVVERPSKINSRSSPDPVIELSGCVTRIGRKK